MGKYKPTILIDWDGTIGQYDGKYVPGVVGAPLEGARAMIYALIEREGYDVKVFTTREAEIIAPVLAEFGFPKLKVTNYKSPAYLMIDDRAICFQGEWNKDLLDQIKNFKPWWKRPSSSAASPKQT